MRLPYCRILVCALLVAGTPATAEDTVRLGAPFPNMTVTTLLAPGDYAALGLDRTAGPVSIDEIPADLLVLEFFNKYCLTCWHMAPQLNTFSELLDPGDLGDRVRILSIGAGNDMNELQEFRREFKIDYAMAPDPMFELFNVLGDLGGTPTTFFLLRGGNGWVVAENHTGFYGDVALLARARVLLRSWDRPPRAPDRASAKVGGTSVANREMVRQFLSRVVGSPVEVELVDLGETRFLFQALGEGGRQLGVYGRVARRGPVCDLCHTITFLVAFDLEGAVRGFEAVHVTKFGNALWDDADESRLRSNLRDRSLFDLPFDSDVDGVTSATMSSALIFDEFRRCQDDIKAMNSL